MGAKNKSAKMIKQILEMNDDLQFSGEKYLSVLFNLVDLMVEFLSDLLPFVSILRSDFVQSIRYDAECHG